MGVRMRLIKTVKSGALTQCLAKKAFVIVVAWLTRGGRWPKPALYCYAGRPINRHRPARRPINMVDTNHAWVKIMITAHGG